MLENNDTTDRSIEEIESLIAQNKEKMSLLQVIIDNEKKVKEERFNEFTQLMIDLSNYQKQYYDYRTALGSPFFNFSSTDRDAMEMMMPIYKQKIDHLKNKLENIKIEEIL